MVSLWPFKGQDSSPASFERTLSNLSKKITETQARLDQIRTSSRRTKVLWTLYLSFAYLVYAIVLTLVIGWQNLGPLEWTGMAGGPVLIYAVRTATAAFYTYRIEALEARLKEHQAERAKTIQKLKDATRYDSTLELLEKYGGEKRPKIRRQGTGEEEDQEQQKGGRGKKGHQSHHSHAGRTSIAPPPTANIQRPATAAGPSPPHHGAPFPPPPPQDQQQQQQLTAEFAPNAEFTPNAGAAPQPLPYTQYETMPLAGPPRWYDRLLDLMLGEDETAPKNRIVLICHRCRLVNGQAPPGTKTLAELGSWKCMSCGAVNGEMDEGRKIMREVLGGGGQGKSDAGSVLEGDSDRDSDIVKVEGTGDEESSNEGQQHLKPRTRSTNRG